MMHILFRIQVIFFILLLLSCHTLFAADSRTSSPKTSGSAQPTPSPSQPNTLNLTRRHILDEAIITVPSDFFEMGKWTVEHPFITLGVVGVTAGLVAVDKPSTRFLQDHFSTSWSPAKPWYVPPSASYEDSYLLAGLGGLYIAGNIFDSPINQIAALSSIKSVAYSIVISQALLKTLFGRIRPNPELSNPNFHADGVMYTNNPWDFFRKMELNMRPVAGPTSMPSYHFTEFFSVGAALSETYDSYWPYLITAAGLLPNFQGHHHWTSDMFAGAAIGLLIGYSTAHNLKTKLGLAPEQTLVVEPDMKAHGVKVAYHVVFG